MRATFVGCGILVGFISLLGGCTESEEADSSSDTVSGALSGGQCTARDKPYLWRYDSAAMTSTECGPLRDATLLKALSTCEEELGTTRKAMTNKQRAMCNEEASKVGNDAGWECYEKKFVRSCASFEPAVTRGQPTAGSPPTSGGQPATGTQSRAACFEAATRKAESAQAACFANPGTIPPQHVETRCKGEYGRVKTMEDGKCRGRW
jgi:hypothetical protein